MVLGQSGVIAAIGDWATALLFVALLLSWWVFLAWWISRYGGRDVAVAFRSPKPPDEALGDWTDYYGTWLAGAGYDVVDHRADRIAFAGCCRSAGLTELTRRGTGAGRPSGNRDPDVEKRRSVPLVG